MKPRPEHTVMAIAIILALIGLPVVAAVYWLGKMMGVEW